MRGEKHPAHTSAAFVYFQENIMSTHLRAVLAHAYARNSAAVQARLYWGTLVAAAGEVTRAQVAAQLILQHAARNTSH